MPTILELCTQMADRLSTMEFMIGEDKANSLDAHKAEGRKDNELVSSSGFGRGHPLPMTEEQGIASLS
jgi:hypothetical protein